MTTKKPTKEDVDRYVAILERYLQYQKIKIKIILNNFPLEITTYLNERLDEKETIWIDEVLISSPDVKDLNIKLPTIDIKTKEQDIWIDACEIQHFLYCHLKKDPGNPKSGDPYWKLWNFINNK